jgi:hypothetical protein
MVWHFYGCTFLEKTLKFQPDLQMLVCTGMSMSTGEGTLLYASSLAYKASNAQTNQTVYLSLKVDPLPQQNAPLLTDLQQMQFSYLSFDHWMLAIDGHGSDQELRVQQVLVDYLLEEFLEANQP